MFFPRYCETAVRSARLSGRAILIMAPKSSERRMRDAVISPRAALDGMRGSDRL